MSQIQDMQQTNTTQQTNMSSNGRQDRGFTNTRGMLDGFILDTNISRHHQFKELTDNIYDVFVKMGIPLDKTIIRFYLDHATKSLIVSMNGKGITRDEAVKAQEMFNLHENDGKQNGKYGLGSALVRTKFTNNEGCAIWVSLHTVLNDEQRRMMDEGEFADIGPCVFSRCTVDLKKTEKDLHVHAEDELNRDTRKLWEEYAVDSKETGTVMKYELTNAIYDEINNLITVDSTENNLCAYIHRTYQHHIKNGSTIFINDTLLRAEADVSQEPWSYNAKITCYRYDIPEGLIGEITKPSTTWIGKCIMKDQDGVLSIPTKGRQQSGYKLKKKQIKKYKIDLENIDWEYTIDSNYTGKAGGDNPWEGIRGILTHDETREIYKEMGITLPHKVFGEFGKHYNGLFVKRCNTIIQVDSIEGLYGAGGPPNNEHESGPVMKGRHIIQHREDNNDTDKKYGVSGIKAVILYESMSDEFSNEINVGIRTIIKNIICKNASLKVINELRRQHNITVATQAAVAEAVEEEEEEEEEEDSNEEASDSNEEASDSNEEVEEEEEGEEEVVEAEVVEEEEEVLSEVVVVEEEEEEQEEHTTDAIQSTIVDNQENDVPNFNTTSTHREETEVSPRQSRDITIDALEKIRDHHKTNTNDETDGLIRERIKPVIAGLLRGKVTTEPLANVMIKCNFGMVNTIDIENSIDMLIGFYTNLYHGNTTVYGGDEIHGLYEQIFP